MKKYMINFALTLLLGFSVLANSAPIITFDSREGAGLDLHTTQGVHYDAANAFWAVSAKALAISFDDGLTFAPLVNGTVDLRGRFISASSDEESVSGQFTTFGEGPSIDLQVSDQTGLLLAGTYGARTIQGILGSTSGTSESTFNADSGSLAALFPADAFSGRMTNSLFDIFPVFSAASFSQDFDGDIDGLISSVPEPSGLALFMIGLCLIIYSHKHANKNRNVYA